MDKIEIEEYVRTKDGYIAKCIEIETDFSVCGFDNTIRKDYGNKLDFLYLEDIAKCVVKHSKQLTDLIEVGDIIKYRIDNISTTLETKGYIEGIVDIADDEMFKRIKSDKNYKILEILTKEQYIADCYKVEGE